MFLEYWLLLQLDETLVFPWGQGYDYNSVQGLFSEIINVSVVVFEVVYEV